MSATFPRHYRFERYRLGYQARLDAKLQAQLEPIDSSLRTKYAMTPEQTAVGLLDLMNLRLAMLRPDRLEYAASLAKLGILLAYFELRPLSAANLDPETRRELGLMIKSSSNEMAARFSRELGLLQIQAVLNSYGFYDPARGGGIWVGKHYGDDSERIGDPVGDHSHAVTVRQLLRFYLLLEQDKLAGSQACAAMREILASPDIPHDQIKFVKGLEGRGLDIRRKWGSWESWLHDSAVISGPDRHYILVGLTHHQSGDAYLAALAPNVDDLMHS